MKKKVIILVRNSGKYPSNVMIPFIKRTWVKNTNHKVFFIVGGSSERKINGNNMYLTTPRGYMQMLPKIIESIEYINEEKIEFDYLFATTTGSYINFNEFDKFINNLPEKNVYAGPLDFWPPVRPSSEQIIPFVSGRGNLFSKDITNFILENKNLHNYDLIDDVAWGKLLIVDNQIRPYAGYRQDFKNFPRLNDINFNNYHYGFRLDTWGIPRIFEIFSLISLHNRMKFFYSKEKGIFKLLLIKLSDCIVFNLLLVIRFLNFKYHLVSYKTFLNRLLNSIYQLLKKNKIIYKFLSKAKNKYNIRTEI